MRQDTCGWVSDGFSSGRFVQRRGRFQRGGRRRGIIMLRIETGTQIWDLFLKVLLELNPFDTCTGQAAPSLTTPHDALRPTATDLSVRAPPNAGPRWRRLHLPDRLVRRRRPRRPRLTPRVGHRHRHRVILHSNYLHPGYSVTVIANVSIGWRGGCD